MTTTAAGARKRTTTKTEEPVAPPAVEPEDDDEPVSGPDFEDDEEPVSAVGVEDAEEEDEEVAVAPTQPPASAANGTHPRSGPGKAPWLHRVNAERSLRNAIALLEKHDFLQWDVQGVPGAIGILKHALTKFPQKKATKPIVAGAIADIRAKAASRYEGVLEGENLKGLQVETVRKAWAFCKTVKGERINVPTKDLEAR